MKNDREDRARVARAENEHGIDIARRRLLGALAAVPSLAVLGACNFDPLHPGGGGSGSGPAISVSDSERNRRRRLVSAHVGEENQHDIDGLMETFSEHA